MFDIEEKRTTFASLHGADVAIVAPDLKVQEGSSKTTWDLVQDYAKQVISDHDLGHGFDVTVEASGAQVCAQMAVCMLKAGGTCKSSGTCHHPLCQKDGAANYEIQAFKQAWASP